MDLPQVQNGPSIVTSFSDGINVGTLYMQQQKLQWNHSGHSSLVTEFISADHFSGYNQINELKMIPLGFVLDQLNWTINGVQFPLPPKSFVIVQD